MEDCRVKTPFGGISGFLILGSPLSSPDPSVTLLSFIVIAILFISETLSYFSVDVVEQLYVVTHLEINDHFWTQIRESKDGICLVGITCTIEVKSNKLMASIDTVKK